MAAATPNWRYWTGLTDAAVDGQYVWDSTGSESPTFRNWDFDEPNGSTTENCIEILVGAAAGPWNDITFLATQPRTGFIRN